MIRWIKDHLVPEARKWWAFWSLRFNAIGLFILSFVQFDPIMALKLFNMMPAPVRMLIPGHTLLGLAAVFFFLGTLSVFVKQPKLHNRRSTDKKDDE
jgi:hypothetical protein